MKHLALISLITLTLISGCDSNPTKEQLDGKVHYAIIRGDLEIAKKVLAQSDDPAALTTKYLPTAMIHTQQNHDDMIKLFVNNGADVNAPAKRPLVNDGLTFQNITPDLLRWLIENGYDVNQADVHGRTALSLCLERLNYSNFDKSSDFYKMFQILLDNDADVNISTPHRPILHEIVVFGNTQPKHKELLKLLIDAGADLELKDKSGRTVLLTAIEYGKEGMAELLLEHGASYDTSDEHGTTALFKAANMGFVTCVEMLIAQGADVNKVNSGGFTPLHFAVSGGNEEIVKMLLDNGAKVNTVNENSQTPLDRADRYTTCRPDAGTDVKKQKLIDLLTQHGAKRATELKETNA